MVNLTYEANKKKAIESDCFGCGYLHIGIDVDHNHCCSPYADSTSYKRVGGQLSEDRCSDRV